MPEYWNKIETTLSSGDQNQCTKEAFLSLTRLSEATIAKYAKQKICNDMTLGSSFVAKQEKEIRYKCDKCNKSFSRNSHLKTHIKNVHENVQYNCDKCDKNFSTNHYLSEHIQIVHENVQHKCEKSYPTNMQLKRHSQSKHEIDIFVTSVTNSFQERTIWTIISRVFMKMFHTIVINVTGFSSKQHLTIHIKSLHENVWYNSHKWTKAFLISHIWTGIWKAYMRMLK